MSGPRAKTVEENILANVILSDGCWEWGGPHDKDGYAVINSGSKRIFAHRAVYECLNGPFPLGMESGSCHSGMCATPVGAEIVTQGMALLGVEDLSTEELP